MKQIYLFSDKKFKEVINIPLLETKYLDFEIDLSNFDAIIFTSKRAIYALELKNIFWQNKKIFCIGEPTASVAKEHGAKKILSLTSKTAKEFAQLILQGYKEHSFFYPRASEVANDIYAILKDKVKYIQKQDVYETKCKELDSFELQKNSVLIFTSPKIVRCFMQNFTFRDDLCCIAIGNTTKKAFPKNIKVQTPQIPTIRECINLALNN